MQRYLLFAFSMLAIVGLTAPHAAAAPVTYQFTGHIDGGGAGPPFPPATADSNFHGTFTYDNAWVDALGGDPTRGLYSGSGAPYGFTINLGGGTFRFEALDMLRFNNWPADGIRLQFIMAAGDPGATFEMGGTTIPVDVGLFFMEFFDSTGAAFSSDAPLPLPPFSFFDSSDFGLQVGRAGFGTGADYRGVLDSITPTLTDAVPQVPVPAALPLFLTGLGGMGLLAWRRKRKVCRGRRALKMRGAAS